MKPPRNPLAGTRRGERGGAKLRRGIFVPRFRKRLAPGESRAAQVDPMDDVYRGLGVPVYDVQAGQGELGGYMAPRDGF